MKPIARIGPFLKSWSLQAALSVTLVSQVIGQSGIAIPGSPKGDMAMELLQSRAYCRSMERQLESIKEQFPALSLEILAAEASWKSSPFAVGCSSIEEDILQKAGDDGRAMLRQMDEATWAEAKKHTKIVTIAEARDFLALVDRRAKGAIEVPMVRGNLLWQYKPFQEEPEREIARGYVQKITHTARIGRSIHFEIPMSWKTEESPTQELMSFRNCYGHGDIWMTVLVSPTTDAFGQPIPAQKKFESYSEASLRAEYKTLGIELTSFLRTQVNGMPALLFTREQPYEQLGQRATRAAEVIRVFSGKHMISFQINTLGPEGGKTATDRIKKSEPLFKMIGGSLSLR
jgi:hypothetical protein